MSSLKREYGMSCTRSNKYLERAVAQEKLGRWALGDNSLWALTVFIKLYVAWMHYILQEKKKFKQYNICIEKYH